MSLRVLYQGLLSVIGEASVDHGVMTLTLPKVLFIDFLARNGKLTADRRKKEKDVVGKSSLVNAHYQGFCQSHLAKRPTVHE